MLTSSNPRMNASSRSIPRTEEPIITRSTNEEFRKNFNRNSFTFRHSLAGHPLFELERLARLAETILARGAFRQFTHREAVVDAASTLRESAPQRVARAIMDIDKPGSWMKLTQVQMVDPEYGALVDRLIEEIQVESGVPIVSDMNWLGATIFLGSPGSVTPYHIDHEINFLFLVRGEKTVNLFDPTNRSVLTEEEIENFYVGDSWAARYRVENQSKARVYRIRAGDGVHHPSLAPHWVTNGSGPTIAFSVAFGQRSTDPRARVYQVNRYLRKFGFRPTPLGQSRWRDSAKIVALGLLSMRNPKTDRDYYASAIERIQRARQLVMRPFVGNDPDERRRFDPAD